MVKRPVSDIMTPGIVAVAPRRQFGTSLRSVEDQAVRRSWSSIPAGQLLGIIGWADMAADPLGTNDGPACPGCDHTVLIGATGYELPALQEQDGSLECRVRMTRIPGRLSSYRRCGGATAVTEHGTYPVEVACQFFPRDGEAEPLPAEPGSQRKPPNSHQSEWPRRPTPSKA